MANAMCMAFADMWRMQKGKKKQQPPATSCVTKKHKYRPGHDNRKYSRAYLKLLSSSLSLAYSF